MSKVRIEHGFNEEHSLKCSIKVDGYEMADKISCLSLEMRPNHVPVVKFEMPVSEVEIEADFVAVCSNDSKKDSWERICELTDKISKPLAKAMTEVLEIGTKDEK